MFKSLKGLIGNKPQSLPERKARDSTVAPARDFRAVAIVPGMRCCQEAKVSVRERYLLRDAPRLPLSACTMPTGCSCKFKKVPDRRDEDRRMLGVSETGQWYAGKEKRTRRSRRSGE
jgi:hypothetical protein